MEWRVVKLGIEQFDILHAYGLGILLATVCGIPVELRDTACSYALSCSIDKVPRVHSDMLLESVLPLPAEEEIRMCDPSIHEQQLPMTVLDGLLAALFTTPGPRALSVSDLLGKQRLDAEALKKGLLKVTKKINQWKDFATRAAPGKQVDWLDDVLRDYHPEHPASPTLTLGKYDGDIHLLMTIDPSFCFSLRSALSHGRMTEKTQVAVRGTRYAALLAFIGAARFLRAQRLASTLVNCYVPVARNLSLDAETTLPLLLSADEKPDQAALRRWLALLDKDSQPQAVWSGLAYQTLLTQGQQQSLSLESGVLECDWLLSLRKRLGTGVLAFWQAQLHSDSDLDAQEHLFTCLKHRCADDWFAYLRLWAQGIQANSEYSGRRYRLDEIRRITETMNDAEHLPLKHVLEREKGTLCFGRALRQIGRSNSSLLRDLLDELQEARTDAQLFPVLQRVVFASELEKAKGQKISIPTEEDMHALLEDIDRYGVVVLVGLLMVLSALHYPYSHESLKYELSALIRVLLALLVQLAALSETQDQPVSHALELFIDDPEVSIDGALFEEQKES